MALNKIMGIGVILFAILIGLVHFGFISEEMFGINLVLIGVFVFLAHNLHAILRGFSHEGNKVVSIGVPALFILIGASYFFRTYLPSTISSSILLLIAVLMLAEGLYRLH